MPKKLLLLFVLLALAAVFFAFDLDRFFSEEELRSRQQELQDYRVDHAVGMAAAFSAIYILMAALSLPAAGLMTIAAGVIFGLVQGVVLVSFSSTIGATLAFLAARTLLRDSVQAKFGGKLLAINRGIRREGAFYLFSLRMIPLFPFFLINLLFGLTSMRARTFFWVSQLGMLAGTVAFVNAGTQLAQLHSLRGIVSPAFIGSFVLLGLLPLISKRVLDGVKARRAFAGHRPPSDYDYNIVVIGAGSGGLVSAYIAAAAKAKVALIERHRMGGDCLNTGCVPSKALLRSAKMLHYARRAEDWGFRSTEVDYDFGEVMERVQRVITRIEPHDSVERYTGLGVECVEGEARIVDPWTVEVGGRKLTTKNIVIATGARPMVPPIPGVEEAAPLTSDTVWGLRERPGRLVVVGGGPVGCELSQAFSRLGCAVTQVEALPRIMAREDEDAAEFVRLRFEAEGIRVLAGHAVVRFERNGETKVVICEGPGGEVRVECDEILMALGRQPNVKGFGLEQLGVELSERGTVGVDEFLRTNYPNIFAVGDVAGPYQFTHVAAHQAWYAAVNALFSPLKSFRADYRVIPWTTFTDPEVARVGFSEAEAAEQGLEVQVTKYGIENLDRAIADGEDYGMVKVLTVPNSDRILGVTIVGSHAGDILTEYVTAMKHGIGLNKILGTIHTYPTLGEANKYAAGQWKQANKPEGALRMLERFHGLRRSRRKSRMAVAACWLLAVLVAGCVAGCVFFGDDGKAPALAPRPEEAYAAPDVGAYARVLSRVVDARGLVDYGALIEDRGDLKAYYHSVAYLDRGVYDGWDEVRQRAFWCNVYNALTLELIAENYPIESTLQGILHPANSIQQIPAAWKSEQFTVLDRKISLNQIEHGILRGEEDHPLQLSEVDPRIHMAINCASIGCPPLRAEPFAAARLDQQFDDQARRFLGDAEKFRIDREEGEVLLSMLFKWFGEDFVDRYAPSSGYGEHSGELRAVLRFCAASLDDEDAAYLRDGDHEIEWLDYDWSLNEQ